MQLGKRKTRVTPLSVGLYCSRDNESWVYIKGKKLLDQTRNHEDTPSTIKHVLFTFTVALIVAFSRRGMMIYKHGIRQQRDKQAVNTMKTSKTRGRSRK